MTHESFDPWPKRFGMAVHFLGHFLGQFFWLFFNCQRLIGRHLKPQMRFYNCKYFKKSATFFKAFYTHIVGFSIMAFSSVNMASKTHNSNFITETINSTSWVTIHSIKSNSQFFSYFPQMSLDFSTFPVSSSILGTQLMTFLTNFRKLTTKNDKYKILKSFIRRIYCFSNKITFFFTVVGFKSHVYRRKSHNWKSYNMRIKGFKEGCGFFKVLTIVKISFVILSAC